MENQIINIDSRFRDKEVYRNAGRFTYYPKYRIKNITYVRLSSIELPNMYYTFTRLKQNISFKIIIPGTEAVTTTITISEGSYTSDLLLNHLQDQIDAFPVLTNIGIQVSFDDITSKINFRSLTSTAFNLAFSRDDPVPSVYPTFGYQLGFRQDKYTGLSTYTSESVLDVTGDHYVLVRVNNYGFMYNEVCGEYVLAKIRINRNKTSVIYDDGSNLLTKEYRFRLPVNLDKLEIELMDPYGRTLDMIGQDFSLTLEIGQVVDYIGKEVSEGETTIPSYLTY